MSVTNTARTSLKLCWLLAASAAISGCPSDSSSDDGDAQGTGSTTAATTGGMASSGGSAETGGASDSSGGSTAATGGDEGTTVDPESAAGLELVALYAGTYDVTATEGTHARGTVTISDDGTTFDFDTGLSFTLLGDNVYNRIPNFADEPRVQIEIPGTPQQRLRIFVDPDDTASAIRFTYDDNADDEAPAVDVMVTTTEQPATGGESATGGSMAMGTGGSSGSTLSAGDYGASFEAGGSTISALQTDPRAAIPITGLGDQRFLELGGGGVVEDGARLRMLPINQTGSYECGKGPSDFRLVEMIVRVDGVEYRADKDTGGSCSIDVTAAGDTYEGTFSGTLLSVDGASVTVSGGLFRNDGSMLN